jgi:hypothetical protein
MPPLPPLFFSPLPDIVGFAGTFMVWFQYVGADDAGDLDEVRHGIITSLNGQSEETPAAELDTAGFVSFKFSIITLFSAAMGDFSFDEINKEQPIFGPILLMLYLFVGAIMLLNLLIAILGDIYARVKSGAKEEYLFARAQTVVNHSIYWDGRHTAVPLPPPLNLITFLMTPLIWLNGALYNVVTWCMQRRRRQDRHIAAVEDDGAAAFPLRAFMNVFILVQVLSLVFGVLVLVGTLLAYIPQALFALLAMCPYYAVASTRDILEIAASKMQHAGAQGGGALGALGTALGTLVVFPLAWAYHVVVLATFIAIMIVFLTLGMPLFVAKSGFIEMSVACDKNHLDVLWLQKLIDNWANPEKLVLERQRLAGRPMVGDAVHILKDGRDTKHATFVLRDNKGLVPFVLKDCEGFHRAVDVLRVPRVCRGQHQALQAGESKRIRAPVFAAKHCMLLGTESKSTVDTLDAVCSQCDEVIARGDVVHRCNQCNYTLCLKCFPQTTAARQTELHRQLQNQRAGARAVQHSSRHLPVPPAAAMQSLGAANAAPASNRSVASSKSSFKDSEVSFAELWKEQLIDWRQLKKQQDRQDVLARRTCTDLRHNHALELHHQSGMGNLQFSRDAVRTHMARIEKQRRDDHSGDRLVPLADASVYTKFIVELDVGFSRKRKLPCPFFLFEDFCFCEYAGDHFLCARANFTDHDCAPLHVDCSQT